MRMVEPRKLAAISLSVLLVLVMLAGCTKGSGSDGNASGTGDGGSISTKTEDSTPTAQNPLTLKMFIDYPWYPVKEWKGPIADALTQKTGIKLDITVAADATQLSTMIASGDLPDLVFTGGQNGIRMSDPNLSYAWNELIPKYAPDFEIDPIRKAINTASDGNIYTVLNSFATAQEWEDNKYAVGSDGNPGLAVRSDILKQLGNPPIKTLDDFVNILEQVKSKYPDMIPLVLDPNWQEGYFQVQFGVSVGGSEMNVGKDGKLHFYITDPNMLEYYKFFNMLYSKGLILPENFAMTNSDITGDYAHSGKAFAHMGTVSMADMNNVAAKKDGKPYTWEMLPEALTPQASIIDDGIGFAGTFITKSNKHPAESIKFLQYLAQPDTQKLMMWGEEGKDWQMNEDGYPDFNYDPTDDDYVSSQGLKWYYFYSDGIYEFIRGYVPESQNTKALLEIKNIKKFDPVLGMVQPPANSEYANIKTKLDDLIKTGRTKIILAKTQEEAVQAYNDMIKLANQIGMAKLEQWASEQYAEKQKLMK
ncbi:extracellular solute-binding protein [Paenibacillus sp. XY044]|uniref:extracellular solute-binding protein n=1 Tax=Paenibacillus sp. XY044 TaxID=2026089 RepID=UPI000B99B354|nr:extracellular solute-binding protein [Paenibacillus sp. XY044]OZB92317.1 ABC transporter substrate-binding protein [Paenibacillus sp. XY044]